MKKSILRQAQGKAIVIVGPNASGKSELGVKLAKTLRLRSGQAGEIISADSRQVYKGLDVGSGKVRGGWKKIDGQKKFVYKNIPHYCIDIANPKKVFTALDFKKCAQRAIYDIASRNKVPIIVGGTGFYIDAALGRVRLGGVPPNTALRKKLANYSTTQLFNYLTKLDHKRAKTIEQKNPRRLIRAIEIALKPLSPQPPSPFARLQRLMRSICWQVRGKGVRGVTNDSLNGFFAIFGTVPERSKGQKCAKPSELRAGGARMSEESALVTPSNISWLGIKRTPEELKRRIRARLLRRLPGIIREVKKLHRPPAGGGLSWKRFYDLGLEYRYTSLYLRGKLSHIQLTQQLTSQIWHYAKRQMTWFKKNKEIRWIKNEKEAITRLLKVKV